jgi:hypothetical protein
MLPIRQLERKQKLKRKEGCRFWSSLLVTCAPFQFLSSSDMSPDMKPRERSASSQFFFTHIFMEMVRRRYASDKHTNIDSKCLLFLLFTILSIFSYNLVIELSQNPSTRCTNKRTCVDCPSIPHSFYSSSNHTSSYTPVKAAITILCREQDLAGVQHSLASFEPYFNSKYNYPYVLINETPFSEEFKAAILSTVLSYRSMDNSKPRIIYSVIPPKDWDYPDFISRARARDNLEKSKKSWTISYGGLKSYRFMIRYFSGPFFHNPDLAEFDYYWRGILFRDANVFSSRARC